jgi:hypothetical protein
MSAAPRRPDPAPGFPEGALVALLAALAGSLACAMLGMVLPGPMALALTLAALGLAYLLYLLGRSPERAGRLVMVSAWAAVTALAWGLSPGPWTQLAVQTGSVWLVRSLYFQSSPSGALLDLGLATLGLAAALWAGGHSGSLLLAIWCFFLVQAPFTAIPVHPLAAPPGGPADSGPDPFALAERAAGAALSRLAQTH